MKTSGGSLLLEAAATFGLEAVVRDELLALGISVTSTMDRRVLFEGTPADMARCNIRLRTADRVWLRMADFPATDFDDLYEGVRQAPWSELVPRTAAVVVKARSTRRGLPPCPPSSPSPRKPSWTRSWARGDIRPRRSARRRAGRCTPSRSPCCGTAPRSAWTRAARGCTSAATGRRPAPAPLRENLAAALVLLSRWDASRPFADPLCGSGTIAIEAALIARGAAPGIRRRFAAEEWPALPARIWQDARQEARDSERREAGVTVAASDKDPAMVEAAARNAAKAGVSDSVRFRCAPLGAFQAEQGYGCIVSNPPYGERLGERRDVDALSREMGDLYRKLETWSFFILTASTDFPRLFGTPFSKNRKLYNGNMQCYLYQWFGPLPRGLPR